MYICIVKIMGACLTIPSHSSPPRSFAYFLLVGFPFFIKKKYGVLYIGVSVLGWNAVPELDKRGNHAKAQQLLPLNPMPPPLERIMRIIVLPNPPPPWMSLLWPASRDPCLLVVLPPYATPPLPWSLISSSAAGDSHHLKTIMWKQ